MAKTVTTTRKKKDLEELYQETTLLLAACVQQFGKGGKLLVSFDAIRNLPERAQLTTKREPLLEVFTISLVEQ